MKMIKTTFAAILLMLLLTSISSAWQPPPINGPIRISDVDGHPWGGTSVECDILNPSEKAYSLNENIGFLIESASINLIQLIFPNFKISISGKTDNLINWNRVSSEDERNNSGKP